MNKDTKNKIEALKKEIDSYRPLSKDVEGRIMQKFRLDWNFHSNNIEGNQLTFGETKTFLLHGITADKKPLKDHLDIKGHNEALLQLEDIVKKDYLITENFIREMHEVVLHEPYENPAISSDGKRVMRKINIGQYKSKPNHVITKTGETFYFASPEETPAKMNDLIQWYRSEEEKQELHPIELASQFHYKFIRIHPFDDGNGRMARILMNLILMRNGFPPVVIKTQDKDNYFKALQAADGGDITFFENYIADNMVHSLELFLRGAKGEDISEWSDLDKEIALFKKERGSENLPKVIERSDRIITERYYDTFRPLFNKLIVKLNVFDSLFTSVEVSSYLNSKGSKGGIKYLDSVFSNYLEALKPNRSLEDPSMLVPDTRISEDWRKIFIDYDFNGYNKDGLNTFYCSTKLSVFFDQFNYTIVDENKNILIKNLYSQKISDTKIDEITKVIKREVFEYIKSQINKT